MITINWYNLFFKTSEKRTLTLYGGVNWNSGSCPRLGQHSSNPHKYPSASNPSTSTNWFGLWFRCSLRGLFPALCSLTTWCVLLWRFLVARRSHFWIVVFTERSQFSVVGRPRSIRDEPISFDLFLPNEANLLRSFARFVIQSAPSGTRMGPNRPGER